MSNLLLLFLKKTSSAGFSVSVLIQIYTICKTVTVKFRSEESQKDHDGGVKGVKVKISRKLWPETNSAFRC